MNLLIVLALAGDSTMTRFLAIAERPKLRARATIFRGASAGRDSTHGGVGRSPLANLLLFFVVRAARRLVLLRLVVESFVRDAEDFGGFAAVAVGHVERLFDDQTLDLVHR